MLVAAAVCPHPPLLVPAIAAGSAPELDALRQACATAVARLMDSDPDLLVVAGDAPGTGGVEALTRADFRPFGITTDDAHVGEPAAIMLPLSLSVGRWLIGVTDPCRIRWQGLDRGITSAAAARLGAQLTSRAPRVALLAMGDGTARRTTKAPGSFDPRAEPLDTEIAAALATADVTALLALDPARCDEQMVAGRASWQLLAGAAAAARTAWTGELLSHVAPYGVGYFVAAWRPR